MGAAKYAEHCAKIAIPRGAKSPNPACALVPWHWLRLACLAPAAAALASSDTGCPDVAPLSPPAASGQCRAAHGQLPRQCRAASAERASVAQQREPRCSSGVAGRLERRGERGGGAERPAHWSHDARGEGGVGRASRLWDAGDGPLHCPPRRRRHAARRHAQQWVWGARLRRAAVVPAGRALGPKDPACPAPVRPRHARRRRAEGAHVLARL
mmetsp:Transcript_9869/g.31488  ORF Transcript_9869/g.31488 Transcript_9869/m.31488 type:complete len:212 (-) Transcript_9869:218-853(-)